MSKQYNICLDVGGTKVLGAIFDEKDQIQLQDHSRIQYCADRAWNSRGYAACDICDAS